MYLWEKKRSKSESVKLNFKHVGCAQFCFDDFSLSDYTIIGLRVEVLGFRSQGRIT